MGPEVLEALPAELEVLEALWPDDSTQVRLYRCLDRSRGVEVVAKLARGDRCRSIEAEARALRRLTGRRHVLDLVQAGSGEAGPGRDRVVWLVAQYAPGGSLAQRIGSDAPTARRWAGQLAEALAHVHAAGVTHGDVTPPNVLLDAGDAVVLGDFGSAHMDLDASDAQRHFGHTPAHAAPERAREEPPAPASDVYGLASTILMVCGDHQGLGGSARRLLERCLGPAPQRPSAEVLAGRLGA